MATKKPPFKAWAYLSPTGSLLTSTVREKPGDSGFAFYNSMVKYRFSIEDCTLARVIIDIVTEDGA